MALLPFIAFTTLRQPRLTDIGELTAGIALAILGNAAVFGLLATAHHRYGARMIWLPAFALAIALVCLYERRTVADRVATAEPVPAGADGVKPST
jgi:hypothetical protein